MTEVRNGIVILNRTAYDNVLFSIINDSSKFKPIGKDPTLTREGRLQRFLRDLKKQGKLENVLYDSIYPNGSRPARIYGLPKMHKLRDPTSTPPFRPIVSSIGTYNYNLAKLLCNLLEPYIPNDYNASDTFTFVQEINNLPMFGKFLISFDVESLFTNIPLEECIDLAVSPRETLTSSLPPLISNAFFHLLLLKLTFYSKVPFMTRLMGLPWVHP